MTHHRTREQHAIVKRVEKVFFRNPAMTLDEIAVHQCDLAGWTTAVDKT